MSFVRLSDGNDGMEAPKKPKLSDVKKKEEKKVEKVAEPVKEPAPVKEEPKKAIPQIARVLPDLCNIRKTPSMSGEVLKVVPKNAEFKVVMDESTDDFVAVNVDGTMAYIKKDCVTVFDNPAYAAGELAMKLGGR